MALVNFIRRDNSYLPGEPKEGTFYWLEDNTIWFAPYGMIREDEDNGGLIRIDNSLDIKGVIEIVNSLKKADISYVDDELLKIRNEIESLIESSEFDEKLDKLRNELIKTIEDVFTELFVSKQDTLVSGENIKTINGVSLLGGGDVKLPTTEYVDEKVSEHKLKWRVIM